MNGSGEAAGSAGDAARIGRDQETVPSTEPTEPPPPDGASARHALRWVRRQLRLAKRMAKGGIPDLPPLNREVISAHARDLVRSMRSGEVTDSVSHHKHQADAVMGDLLTQATETESRLKVDHARLAQERKKREDSLKRTPEYVEVPDAGTSWTGAHAIELILMIGMVVLLMSLAYSVVQYFAELNAMLPEGQNWVIAAVTIMVAIAVEQMWHIIPNRDGKRFYHGAVWAFAGVAGCTWMVGYVKLIAARAFASTTLGDVQEGTELLLQVWLFAQLATEILVAGGCLIRVMVIVDEHRHSRPARNSKWIRLQNEISMYDRAMKLVDEAITLVRGRRVRLEGIVESYLGEARAQLSLRIAELRTNVEDLVTTRRSVSLSNSHASGQQIDAHQNGRITNV